MNPDNTPVDTGSNQPAAPMAPSTPDTPTAPNAPTAPVTPEAQPFKPAKKSRKKLAIILSIIGVLIAAVAAAAIWWFAYYNNDRAILKSAFDNLLTQQSGTFDMELTANLGDNAPDGIGAITANAKIASDDQGNTSGDFSLSVDISGEALKVEGAMYAAANGDAYVKLGGLKPVVDMAVEMIGSEEDAAGFAAMEDLINPIIDKVDGKWIKISTDDIKSMTGEDVNLSETQKCMADVTKRLRDDAAVRKNLLEALKSEGVLTAKRVDKNADSFKYELTFDGTNIERFGQNIAGTEIVEQIANCTGTTAPVQAFDEYEDAVAIDADDIGANVNNILADANVKIYFWVDRKTREASRLEIVAEQTGEGNASFKLSMTNDRSAPNMPAAPTNATSVQDLMADLEGIAMMLMMQGMSQSDYDFDDLEDFDMFFN
jgi:hypothetical protein